jgi:parallel beta-helix repeat protein
MKYLFTIFVVLCLLGSLCFARDIFVHAGSQAESSDGSETLPFETINDALKIVQAGDTVIIHEGIYRESVTITGGELGKPVSIKAADSERVVLSGAIPVTGWKKGKGSIYTAVLDFQPKRLLLNYKPLPIAREPDKDWWIVSDVNDLAIMDPKNLTKLGSDIVGAEAYFWVDGGDTFFTVPVDFLDRVNGTFKVVRNKQWMEVGIGDRYYLRNHPSFIDSPGDWAVQEENGKFKVYFQPASEEDLNSVEAPRRTRPVIKVSNARCVNISGLEIAASVQNGIEVRGSENVTIMDCIIHNNDRLGILILDTNDVTIRHNISFYNYCGVVINTASDVIVEENEIAHNAVDGLIVSYNSSNITVRRNYIHHHFLGGRAHPDNIQLYADVKNISFIDNLLIAAGQSIMMAGTSDGLMKGNMIIGSIAYSLIFGHKAAENYRLYNNTIAFSGLGCISLTARDYDVRENVIVSGHSGGLVNLRDAEHYTGDRNLFFNAQGLARKIVMVSDKGWHRSFNHYQRATGYDSNSIYSDPLFRNAPVAVASLDHRHLIDCSRETLFLRGGTDLFRLGDIVEFNFDGVPRSIVDRNNAAITLSPALQTKPITTGLIFNWEQNKNFSWDLRLTSESPGAKLGASGGPVGSTIDIAAYQRGDFNADGKRDLPNIPKELKSEDHRDNNVATEK